jgi:CDP-glycerol glycerophosphotransferase (TagB/SpsB family)
MLLDINFKDGIVTWIVKTNSHSSHFKEINVLFNERELRNEKSYPAHITKATAQQIHFTLPFHFIDFPNPKSAVGTLDIFILSNGEKYKLVILSKYIKNKITYSFLPIPINIENQLALFTVNGRRLSLVYGSYNAILKNRKSDKIIIRDIKFCDKENSLTFGVQSPFYLRETKLVLIERNSKMEWFEDIHSKILNDSRLIHINLNGFMSAYYNQASRWDIYLETVNFQGTPERSRLGIFDQELAPKYQRYFNASKGEGINVITPYLTERNGLSLAIIHPQNLISERVKSKLKILKFTMRGKFINGKVHIQLPEAHSFRIKSLILKYRSKSEHIEYSFPISEEKITQTDSIVKFSIDISRLELQNYYWDFYLLVEVDKQECLIRLKNPTSTVGSYVNKKSVLQSYIYGNGFWAQPYITAANTIALLYKKKEFYESSMYFLKEKFAFLTYILFKWYFDRKNIWLGFEKFANSAQDNGFYFFQYCYQQAKRKEFYYIIKQDSPDYGNIQAMEDKVIPFMSFKYMVYLFAAKLLISSESKGHVYDVRAQKGLLKKALDRKRQVFLQHGVIGLKRVDQVYKKTSRNAVDLFVTSSNFEKEIIKNNFGYKEDEIIVTGLSRWDVLTNQSNGPSTILLMPTWRSWMDDLPEDKFVMTEYYKQYVSLLNSRQLEEILNQFDIHLYFFIHPKFKTYIDKFTSINKRVKIFQFGEEQLNHLLMQSSLLITDYSSVSWDMYYQKKPIIFYQFDLVEYIKYQGSYINMETELFGDRAYTVENLISLIEKSAKRNFKEETKYALLRKKYLKYTDQHNSSRIYQEILKHNERLQRKKSGVAIFKSKLIRNLWANAKKNEVSFRLANYLKKILTNS